MKCCRRPGSLAPPTPNRPRTAPSAAEPRQSARRPQQQAGSETVHQGIDDANVAPDKKVACELLCVRFLWDDADYLWITQRAPDEERFLSCNLNLSWPDSAGAQASALGADSTATIAALQEIFDQMIITTRVVTSRARVQEDRFGGWLCYSNFDRAWKAVNTLHELLRAGAGLTSMVARPLHPPRLAVAWSPAWPRSDRSPLREQTVSRPRYPRSTPPA